MSELVIEKQRFDLDMAAEVADGLAERLRPACEPGFVLVCGSVRRLKPEVGDIEIVYVPRITRGPSMLDFFATEALNLADEVIADWFQGGMLDKRRNSRGSEMFGPKNKLMRHVATGIPVDLFATTAECWWNYVVCRTGGAENNVEICNAAIALGWKWNPYGPGFTDNNGEVRRVESERDVFRLVGLPWKEPMDR